MVGRIPGWHILRQERQQAAPAEFPSGYFREEGAAFPLANQGVNLGDQAFGKNNVGSMLSHN
jgi:hypothetical protein